MEERIPQDHPLRRIRKIVDELLKGTPGMRKLNFGVCLELVA
jgi:hypothetical protein